ncbi:DUF2797 domain-containing protein [Streptomyces sp. NA04227]|uniref:DUF2797 domain-containing protein n=1 Tax=Streptomyces sp. NA04227 TaxID=2742136 RepID=UPI001591649D|nr:DUF2797 domain-containing protein [Streptomyces sp. NA04227]QKW07928.1 DUF2797 domain-containing protein [Streptomyces sp. NA04227]
MAWWCTGMRWRERGGGSGTGGPVLGWYAPGRADRESAPLLGERLAFRVAAGRRCLGVWRGGRWTPCPEEVAVPGTVTRAQCGDCARIDRAHSVAADTYADDPRPYHVYLAWFGPGLLKVGITGAARGSARLLEQGAVAFTWLGAGPLMAARRAEELLRAALRVPDRIPYAQKRAVRGLLPGPEERATELGTLHARARALPAWPESLAPLPCQVVDHEQEFGLGALPAAGTPGVVGELVVGGTVAGRLIAAAGPDLYLAQKDARRVVIVDSRLLAGWQLVRAPEAAGTTVPVRPLAVVQGGLF